VENWQGVLKETGIQQGLGANIQFMQNKWQNEGVSLLTVRCHYCC